MPSWQSLSDWVSTKVIFSAIGGTVLARYTRGPLFGDRYAASDPPLWEYANNRESSLIMRGNLGRYLFSYSSYISQHLVVNNATQCVILVCASDILNCTTLFWTLPLFG